MKFPISYPSHVKDHVNMVNATIWSLFLFQWHIMTVFNFNILQDVKKRMFNPVECVPNQFV